MVSPHNLLSLKVEKAVGYRRVSGRSQADNFADPAGSGTDRHFLSVCPELFEQTPQARG